MGGRLGSTFRRRLACDRHVAWVGRSIVSVRPACGRHELRWSNGAGGVAETRGKVCALSPAPVAGQRHSSGCLVLGAEPGPGVRHRDFLAAGLLPPAGSGFRSCRSVLRLGRPGTWPTARPQLSLTASIAASSKLKASITPLASVAATCRRKRRDCLGPVQRPPCDGP